MAGHTFLFSPPVQRVKRLIEAGELGTPLYVQSSRVNLGIHRSDVNVVWDLAPHDLSILWSWLGEHPRSVSAIGRSQNGAPADVAFLDLSYPSGCLANLHLSSLDRQETPPGISVLLGVSRLGVETSSAWAAIPPRV